MEPLEVLDISRDALWVLIKISMPLLMTALIVGLIISLFQALTQIQEMTLTFVPKMLAMFFALMIFAPFISSELADYYEELNEYIIKLHHQDNDVANTSELTGG